MRIGIVGLPNVGKSTLFNALLRRQQALAANYPFATIEPNVGIVEVPDERVDLLAELVEKQEELGSGSVPRKHATIEFYDIAGLVAGASKGEGLGNQFLAHIRETDLICHVLRAFEDSDVVVTGKMEPIEDLATVRMELIFKDMETIEKSRKIKAKDIKEKVKIELALDKVGKILGEGRMLNTVEFSDSEWEVIEPLCLLTTKPEIFVINLSEDQIHNIPEIDYAKKLGIEPWDVIYISAKMESELSELTENEQKEYLKEVGISRSGIESMAQAAYKKLGLISFLTCGVIEARAWTIKKGLLAPKAAGTIHTDFEKKFIKVNIVDFKTFMECGGWKECREKGKVRQEGREYAMKDGDVTEFMIGK
jgi:GTP-binding protein YchF